MKRLLYLVPLIAIVVSTIAVITPGSVSAAIPSDSELQKRGEATAECKRVANDNANLLKACGTGYVGGYKNPNAKDDAAKKYCEGVRSLSIQQRTYCATGYEKGQKDRKAADEAEQTPQPSGPLSEAQIKALGESSSVCSEYKVAGSNDPSRNASFNACVAGYVEGVYQDKNRTQACNSQTLTTACNKGYEAGKADKAAKGWVIAPRSANAGDDEDDKQLDCDTTFDNPLTWVICPVVDTLAGIVDKLDQMITNQLSIESDDIFGSSQTSEAYYDAWKSFRNIALGLLVIAGLVIVISQALGMELLDAYTIRKTLPKVLIAALFITLSWPLMKLAVEFTNDLGFGIRRLIYLPFSELGTELDLSFGDGIASTFLNVGGAGAGAAAGLVLWQALGGIGVLLAYAGGAALAVIIAILVLVLRQVAIILLMLLAPLAIIAFVLPNTQKIYKLWWESFSKALLMFPLIAAFIATGRVFSAIAINNGGPINQFIGFVAYFAPYFLIPLTFKFAGGALRQIGGFVNDRGRGGFDRLRKYRNDQTAKRIQAARSGGIYRDDLGQFGKKGRSVGKMLNSFGAYTTDADEMLRVRAGEANIPGFRRGAAVMKGQIEDQILEQSGKGLQKIGGLHYQAGRALGGQLGYFTKGMNADTTQELLNQFGKKDKNGNFTGDFRAPRGLNEVSDLAKILDRGGDGARMAAQELRAKAPLLGSLKGPGQEETQRADLETMGLMAAAQAGRLEGEDIAHVRNTTAEANAKRFDGLSGFADKRTARLLQLSSNQRQDLREGHGIHYNKNGEAYSVFDEKHFATPEARTAVMSIKGTALTNSKAETVERMGDTIKHLYAHGSPEDKKDMELQIKAGLANPYSDGGQRQAWRDIALSDEVGMDPKAVDSIGLSAQTEAERAAIEAGAKPPERPPGATPGAQQPPPRPF